MRTHSLIKTTWQTFRRGRSCLSNLRELSEVLTATKDKGNSVDVVCLNFGGGFCNQNELWPGRRGSGQQQGGHCIQSRSSGTLVQVQWEAAQE